ncbi:hypothetical protein C5167_002550 [Papaver somniferum]|uniref:Wax synthase domain-containing protein n=1 Tax=Papaver somniferum TaxID=3469 RepID=A0A4Y7KY42_PAPSO|nr:hypothetical protein C5167_002550 [Papaver somniferum]
MDEFSGYGGEFVRFINIARNIPKGFPRLLSVLPIVYIFSLLPLNLTSIHLILGAGYSISWLANFKLLLFCFDAVVPSLTSSITLLPFLAITCLPIKLKKSNPSSSPSPSSSSSSSSLHIHGLTCYVMEGFFLGLILIYGYSEQYHHKQKLLNFMIINFSHFFHIGIIVELPLVIYASAARLLLDLEVEPPFGNLLVLSSSFHEFWGRKWNKVTSSLLRPLGVGTSVEI